MRMRFPAAAATALLAFAALACEREPTDLRGELHAMLDTIEEIARDEIDILEDVIERPGRPSLHPVWRDRLDEAISAVEQLPDLRADIDASTDAELAATVGSDVMSVVEEMRRAIDERMRNLRDELGGPQVA